MQLDADWLGQQGDDALLLQAIDDVAFEQDTLKIAIAVSGGGDSMALLHLCKRWSDKTKVPIIAATVDHGLRAAAADEAAFVAAFCADNVIPHTTLKWDGTQASGNVQAAARTARYRLLADWAWENGTDTIVLGHTANDVAETFLMRLARKSGVEGLAAMPRVFHRNRCQFVRPLLQQTRDSLRDYLRHHDVPWVEDPTNDDLTQTRPKARQIIKVLEPLGIDVDVLRESATALASAKSAVQSYAFHEAKRVVSVDRGDVIIQVPPDQPLHAEVDRRLKLAAVRFINGADYAPRESGLANLDLALATQDRHTIGGCLVSDANGTLRFTRKVNAVGPAVVWQNHSMGVSWDNRWFVTQDAQTHTTADLVVRHLGNRIKDVPDWRETGMPRTSLMASPAIFDGETLIAAPIAGLHNGFSARIVTDYMSFLVSR